MPHPTTPGEHPAGTDDGGTCPQERFATLADAQQELLHRRTRATLAGNPPTVHRTAYPCRRCNGAHITRQATP